MTYFQSIKKNIKAFTLLELLIVIAIISVLMSVSVVSYSTAQRKSRDTKRKGDLKAIQNAFEQYYAVNNYKYPITARGYLSGSITSNNVTVISFPSDPTGGYYQCASSCSITSYKVCSVLEAETPGTYCIHNQQ